MDESTTSLLLVITVCLVFVENIIVMFFMYMRLLRKESVSTRHRSNLKE